MTTTQQVTGRNGFDYDATHIVGKYYKVGRQIVVVEGMRVIRNATSHEKASLRRLHRDLVNKAYHG